jgi:hypothetical protein
LGNAQSQNAYFASPTLSIDGGLDEIFMIHSTPRDFNHGTRNEEAGCPFCLLLPAALSLVYSSEWKRKIETFSPPSLLKLLMDSTNINVKDGL